MRLAPPAFWDAPGHPAGALLAPLGAVYASVAARRMRRAEPRRVGVPVVCTGNVTMGGVGKTPWTLLLTEHLAAMGRTPHVLTRGYGGAAKGCVRVADQAASVVGDEARMMAAAVPVWVGADRARTAAAARAAGADVLLMDDGFQNPGLAKDWSFLLLSAELPFGNGRVFPAGPLRERPGAAAARADAVVVVGEGDPSAAVALADGKPVLRARLELDASALSPGEPVHAVAGIGRPERFFAALEAAGHRVVRHAFPDHHPFTDAELRRVTDAADGTRVVTTAKDHARLPEGFADCILPLPARMRTDEGTLDAMLCRVVAA